MAYGSVNSDGHRLTPDGITLVGLRKYSSPNCDPLTGTGCPADSIPVFSSIFAQDTIANSAYNSLQASLDKRFPHGLQFTAAYTLSKSFDEASSFEGILNPIDPRRQPLALERSMPDTGLFSATTGNFRSESSGFAGQIMNGWALSGITTFQTGFPIRITSLADNELMYSFDFELPGEPAQIAPFRTHETADRTATISSIPTASRRMLPITQLPPCSAGAVFGCYDPALFGTTGNASRTICCGPHISNTDFAMLKTFTISETKHIDFRAEFFNIFNHTQFFNPDGNTSDGPQFGQVTQASDPRLMQFALKFFF